MTNTALSLSAYTLDKVIAVNAGETQKLTYTLNLSDSGLQINPAAANSHNEAWATDKDGTKNTDKGYNGNGAQRLGTIIFTFSEYAPAGSKTLTQRAAELGIADNIEDANKLLATAEFYLMDLTTGQVFDAEDVKAMAEDISTANAKGATSVYKAMFDNYVLSDESSLYLCRAKLTVDEVAASGNGLITAEKTSYYKIRVLDVLKDKKADSSGDYAGLTFQFVNGYNIKTGQCKLGATIAGTAASSFSDTMAYDKLSKGREIYNATSFGYLVEDVVKLNNTSLTNIDLSAATCQFFIPSYVEYFGSTTLNDAGTIYKNESGPYTIDSQAWLAYEGSDSNAADNQYAFYRNYALDFTVRTLPWLTYYNGSSISTSSPWSMVRTVAFWTLSATSVYAEGDIYGWLVLYTGSKDYVDDEPTTSTLHNLHTCFCF